MNFSFSSLPYHACRYHCRCIAVMHRWERRKLGVVHFSFGCNALGCLLPSVWSFCFCFFLFLFFCSFCCVPLLAAVKMGYSNVWRMQLLQYFVHTASIATVCVCVTTQFLILFNIICFRFSHHYTVTMNH